MNPFGRGSEEDQEESPESAPESSDGATSEPRPWGPEGVNGDLEGLREPDEPEFDPRRGGPGLRWGGTGSLSRDAHAPDPARAPDAVPPHEVREASFDDPNAPEWPGIGRRPFASFTRRAGGYLIDLVLKVILLEIVLIVTGIGAGNPFGPEVVGTAQTLNLLYNWVFIRRGWTPGIRILKMRITRADGRAPGNRVALIRVLGAIISEVVLFIGYLWMLRDAKRQTWHDKMAGTYVVMIADDEDYDLATRDDR
jgi:uncharacterized RDD family membrane protein YckC